MTVSVCMGIYNGEKYIEEQLYSILHQTKAPEEVILCDDGSTDQTVEIVKKFIRENRLENCWFLYQNEENKGYPDNFYYACSLCTKDIVFLADQDDIWHERKIERMCTVFAKNPQAKSVCCKFGLIDAEGVDIHSLMTPTKSKETGKLRQVTIEDVFYKCEWPGMVMAYRRVWAEEWLRCYSAIPHDFLICARAAEENGFWQLDEELAYHRRHDANVGGEEHRLKKLLNKGRKLEEIEKYRKILGAFAEEAVFSTEHAKEQLMQKISAVEGRYRALQSGKIRVVIKNACNHKKYTRIATVVCDVAIVKQALPERRIK